MIAKNTNNGTTMAVPKWLAGLVSTILGLCVATIIPWMFNISVQVSVLMTQNQHIEKLYEQMNNHIKHPKIHEAGMRYLDLKIENTNEKIEDIKKGQ